MCHLKSCFNNIVTFQRSHCEMTFFFQEATKKQKSRLGDILESFQDELKRQHFFSTYFARSASTKFRFCDTRGWFECEGPYNTETCDKLHKINPYGSKGGRVLFSTWNLDHVYVWYFIARKPIK